MPGLRKTERRAKSYRLNATDAIVQKVQSLDRALWGGFTNSEAAGVRSYLESGGGRRASEGGYAIVDCLLCYSIRYGCWNRPWTIQELGCFGLETMHDVIRDKEKNLASCLDWEHCEPTLDDTGTRVLWLGNYAQRDSRQREEPSFSP